MKKKNESSVVRSSAAEYLTFVASTGESKESIEMRYEDENIWLTQKMLAVLYDVSISAINQHLKNIYGDHELEQEATVKKYLIVQQEGTRTVSRMIEHYNLQAIIAVGFKVNNERAVQFRKWANGIIKDYDPSAKATQRFFAAVQNKLHYSIHGKTAAEVIYYREDSTKEHMGLTSWDGAPKEKIHKYDVSVAKNYLTEKELHQLERIVSAYLDMAEMQAERHIPMTMADWEQRLNGFLTLWDREILKDAGKISAELAKMHAETEFEKYRIIQDRLYQSDFDQYMLKTGGLESGENDE